jgi:3-deoxy-7-phosphoheptulonate synthase
MVDCSHANSAKRHERQLDVATDLAAQVAGGSRHVFGTMIESHLEAGAQAFVPGRDDPSTLRRGQSITDACLGWDETAVALERLADAVARRRAAVA